MEIPQRDPYKAFQCQTLLAEGHRKFGPVAQRKDPDTEGDRGGDNGGMLQPPPSHPLLGAAAQFSGEHKPENPVAGDNPEGEKELQNRQEAKLEKKYANANQKSSTISMRPGRG